jgi:hypothetical protein
MNANRRKQLAEAIAKIEEARTLIEIVRDEEQDAFENMPEGLQSSERGEKMETAVSRMEDSLSELDCIVDALNEASE